MNWLVFGGHGFKGQGHMRPTLIFIYLAQTPLFFCPIFKLFLFKCSGRKAPSYRVNATTVSYPIHEITDRELSIFHVLHIFGPNSFIISPIFEIFFSNVQKQKLHLMESIIGPQIIWFCENRCQSYQTNEQTNWWTTRWRVHFYGSPTRMTGHDNLPETMEGHRVKGQCHIRSCMKTCGLDISKATWWIVIKLKGQELLAHGRRHTERRFASRSRPFITILYACLCDGGH